jgi:hypothetical protein
MNDATTNDGPTITPPPVTTPRPDPVAEARAILAAADAALASARAEREKAEKTLADARAPAAKETAPAPDMHASQLAELKQRLDYIRKDELVAAVKRMGFRHDDWTPARILQFAPDADPRTEAGRLSLDKFRADNIDLFVAPGSERKPMVQEMVEAATKRAQGTPEHPIFGDAYVAKVFQHNFTEKGTR